MPEPEQLLAYVTRWSSLAAALVFASIWFIRTPELVLQLVGIVLLGALLGRTLRRWPAYRQSIALAGNVVVGALFLSPVPVTPEAQRVIGMLISVAIFVLMTPPGGGRMRRRISERAMKAGRVWSRGIPRIGGV